MRIKLGSIDINKEDRELLSDDLGLEKLASREEIIQRMFEIMDVYFTRLHRAMRGHGRRTPKFYADIDKIFGSYRTKR